jgi:hypothetical protein
MTVSLYSPQSTGHSINEEALSSWKFICILAIIDYCLELDNYYKEKNNTHVYHHKYHCFW